MQALDRKLSIAENTLEATLEEEGGLVDISEEQDHALLSAERPRRCFNLAIPQRCSILCCQL